MSVTENGVLCTLGARKRVFLYTSSTKVCGFVGRSGTSEKASLPGWHSLRNWKARMVRKTGGQLVQAHAGLIQQPTWGPRFEREGSVETEESRQSLFAKSMVGC